MAALTLAGAFFGPYHNLAALACTKNYVTFDYIQHETQIDRDTLRFVLFDLKRSGLVLCKHVHGEMYKSALFETQSELKRLPWTKPPSAAQLHTAIRLARIAQP
jgi:hypothetical protein